MSTNGRWPVEVRRTARTARGFFALSDPVRLSALRMLCQRDLAPIDIADELGLPVNRVSYHMRILSNEKLAKVRSTEPRRGAVKHIYTITARGRKTLGRLEAVS